MSDDKAMAALLETDVDPESGSAADRLLDIARCVTHLGLGQPWYPRDPAFEASAAAFEKAMLDALVMEARRQGWEPRPPIPKGEK